MRLRNLLLVGALVVLLAPSTARGDWIVTPFVGFDFSSDATTQHNTPFGVGFGYMSGGIFGLETQISYTHNFFAPSSLIGSNNVFSWMGNVIVGAPIGGYTQVRPYASGGFGLLRSRIGGNAGDLFDINSNDFGTNIGGGVMGFFTPNVGIRGDVRYFRSLTNNVSGGPFGLGLGHFHYWTGTVGVTFKF
jgi:Outer membrane protein beta-barrel domain